MVNFSLKVDQKVVDGELFRAELVLYDTEDNYADLKQFVWNGTEYAFCGAVGITFEEFEVLYKTWKAINESTT